MSVPADPKSIQVRDRVLELLRSMREGADFHLTPVVNDNLKSWRENTCYPAYAVFFGEGGRWQMYSGLNAAETMILIVHGEFEGPDASKDVRKGIRDVRKAIMDDAALEGSSESLQALCRRVALGGLTTDNGAGAAVALGAAWFDQEFEITISGKIEDL